MNEEVLVEREYDEDVVNALRSVQVSSASFGSSNHQDHETPQLNKKGVDHPAVFVK